MSSQVEKVLKKVRGNTNEPDLNKPSSEDESDSASNEENKKIIVVKKTIRGKMAVLPSSDDDSDDSSAMNPKRPAQCGGGIYSMKLAETKNEIKGIRNTFLTVDSNYC